MATVHIFDIDGTMCEDGGILKLEYLDILYALKQKQHDIWIASARWIPTMKDALNHNYDLINTSFATQNGSSIFINGSYHNSYLSQSEKRNFIKFTENNEENILIDFWYKDILYTFSKVQKLNPLEERYRLYLKMKDIPSFIVNHEISMIHTINHLWEEKNYLPSWVNKSLLTKYLSKDVTELNIYWNWDNDIGLFKVTIPNITINRFSVWNNQELNLLSNQNFKDHNNLFKHLKCLL